MGPEDADWMEFIDNEVRTICQARGWRQQVRRKWSIRNKPVSESGIDDYEWKLIPDAEGGPPDPPPNVWDEEGACLRLRRSGAERFRTSVRLTTVAPCVSSS
jgi:hypothetical protein